MTEGVDAASEVTLTRPIISWRADPQSGQAGVVEKRMTDNAVEAAELARFARVRGGFDGRVRPAVEPVFSIRRARPRNRGSSSRTAFAVSGAEHAHWRGP